LFNYNIWLNKITSIHAINKSLEENDTEVDADIIEAQEYKVKLAEDIPQVEEYIITVEEHIYIYIYIYICTYI
jgi:hypothetical protein